MKYKVIFDTNKIFNDWGAASGGLFNSEIPDLAEFLEKHSVQNVVMCLPEMVINERIQQKKEIVAQYIGKINDKIRFLNNIGHAELEVKERNDYDERFRNQADSFASKYKVERIALPATRLENLIERAITKRKPFNDHGSGFKDTLIYLSIVDDALKSETDRYILCTSNLKDFPKEIAEEFQEVTNKELFIEPDTISVRQKLDELLPLGLHLEERNRNIKNIVMSNVGELMYEINKTIGPGPMDRVTAGSSYDYTSVMTTGSIWSDGFLKKREVAGYSFSDLELVTMDEEDADSFTVAVNVRVNVRYQDTSKRPYSFLDADADISRSYYAGSILTDYKTFSVQVRCSMALKNLSVSYLYEI